jgi:hypothetical protein
MIKKIVVSLPSHVKKFFLFEYGGYSKKGIDEIHVDKHSELGKLLHLVSRPIPFTQKPVSLAGPGILSIRYYTHIQALEIPNDKLPLLASYMDEIFRRTMISEVRGGHDLTGSDYGPLVADTLKRRGIERDVDVDYQTLRKVYRDYITKNNRKTAKSYA